jgi:HK97 family phage portal protein
MSWFDRVLGRKRIEDSGGLARILISGRSAKSGQMVNLETALRVSTVLACGRVIAEGCAQTPIKVVEKIGEARRVRDDVAAHRLLSQEPNDWMTAFEFMEQIVFHLTLSGNAFAIKTLSTSGEILELLPLEPGWVVVKQNTDWSLEYRVKFPGQEVKSVPAANIWHLRGPSWANYIGLDTLKMARDAIGLAMATEEFGSSLFNNGARPGGILTTDLHLNAEQQADLRTAWKEVYEGSSNAMKTAVLSGGLKYNMLSMTSDEAQFMETRRYQVEEICRFMRVLPIMIGHSGDKNSTYASAEQMFNVHDKAHLGPWFSRIEQSATKNLLTAGQRDAGLKFKFQANGLMRASAKDRGEYYTKALGSGGQHAAWMTQDEVRALEELNPLGGAASALPSITQPAQSGTSE